MARRMGKCSQNVNVLLSSACKGENMDSSFLAFESIIWGLYRDNTAKMENQMEKKMENEMEAGIIVGYIGIILWSYFHLALRLSSTFINPPRCGDFWGGVRSGVIGYFKGKGDFVSEKPQN